MSKLVAILTFLSTLTLASAAQYDGFLYWKLQAIGTRSEGPAYFLQTFDNRDIPIKKRAMLWQQDPALHAHVGTKVTIDGGMAGRSLIYTSVKPYEFGMRKHKSH